jgi:hypothetical protein
MIKSAFAFATSIIFVLTLSHAQDRKPAGDNVRLNAPQLAAAEKNTFAELLSGKIAVDESHKDLLKRQSQYLVYPVTDELIQFKQTIPETGRTLKQVLDEAFKNIAVPTPRAPLNDNQVKFMREFGKAMVAAIKDVLSNERPIARVNAAIIMAKLGESGIDDLADPMCEIIAGPNYDDAVKNYALTGLANLFIAKGEDRVKDEAREGRCVQTLITFMHRKPPFDPNTRTPEEVEALRYVRREAIRALGETHVPATGKGRQIEAKPAFELLQIVANTADLQPPPSLAERVEAAIGVAQMQRRCWPENNEYQPEYAGYFIGKLVAEFAQEYDKERGQKGATATDWKYLAYRLAGALAEMKKEAVGKWPKLDGVLDRSIAVLNGVVAGGGTDQVALVNFLEQNPPDAKELLRNEPSTAIKPAAPADK